MVYRTAPFSMTFKDPKPRFQGQPFFDAEGYGIIISVYAADAQSVCDS